MEHPDTALFDRYLSGACTQQELADIEARRQSDPEFADALETFAWMRAGLHDLRREELRGRFRGQREADDMLRSVHSPRTTATRRWLAAAVIAAMVITGYWLMRSPDPTPASAHAPTVRDSSAVQPTTPPSRDSGKVLPEAEVPSSQKPAGKKPERPAIAFSKKQGAELFAENFEALPDPDATAGERGDPEDPLFRFRDSYARKHYADCLVAFEKLEDPLRENPFIRLYAANARLATGQAGSALTLLQSLEQEADFALAAEVLWYAALAQLQLGNADEARRYLTAYIQHPDAQQRDRAMTLQYKIPS